MFTLVSVCKRLTPTPPIQSACLFRAASCLVVRPISSATGTRGMPDKVISLNGAAFLVSSFDPLMPFLKINKGIFLYAFDWFAD